LKAVRHPKERGDSDERDGKLRDRATGRIRADEEGLRDRSGKGVEQHGRPEAHRSAEPERDAGGPPCAVAVARADRVSDAVGCGVPDPGGDHERHIDGLRRDLVRRQGVRAERRPGSPRP
jgi:hypothetical protein